MEKVLKDPGGAEGAAAAVGERGLAPSRCIPGAYEGTLLNLLKMTQVLKVHQRA